MIRTLAVLLLLAGALRAQQSDAEREGLEFFEKRIRPVLADTCYSCHSAKAEKVKGALLLDTREGTLKGGETGPAVVPGDLEKSLLIKAVRHVDPDFKMPPKKKLPAEAIADLEAWVKMGAPDPRRGDAPAPRKPVDLAAARRSWAFSPVAEPALPSVRDDSWPRSPIDRFVLAKLEEKNLRPAVDADRRAILRRVTFDLTGLPPTPVEIDAFLADRSPDAWSRVIERLLASPAYGERWGRHWLDVVRYADTAGDNSDFPIPQIHKYRNYVIQSFNDDKPYDQFVREQLAGDLLPWKTDEERHEKIVATGYLANAKRFGSRVDDYPWHLTIEDTIDNLGRTFLGFTVNCARCHDHKFDPFTNEDYYALYGFFASTRYPWPGIELEQRQRDFVPLVPREKAEALLRERAERQAALDAAFKRLEAEKKSVDLAMKEIAEGELARIKEYGDSLAKSVDAAKKEKDQFGKTPLPFETAYAVSEGKTVSNAKMQIKGDPERLGKEVPRRFLEVLGGQPLSSDIKGSGRLQLAEWIVDPANPLAARVLVNRLWHHHFGKGIVATPSDFGKQGRPPTHPELLDWLARRFVESGWSIKAMHRLILHSRTWQLASDDDPAALLADPSNDLLWHHARHRLEAEAIRDSLLAVSGALDRSTGGSHPFPPMTQWDYTQHKPFLAVYESDRRSVYLMTQRIRRHPFFGIFDGAETNMSTSARVTSTTPLQALWFLNDPFVHEQAKRFAERLAKERPDDASRIERAYLLTLGRPPTEEELRAGLEFLSKARSSYGEEAWPAYARVLFRLSEFIHPR
jgi:hypothetical protein